MKIFITVILCFFLVSCNTPSNLTLPEEIEAIILDVNYVTDRNNKPFPGGWYKVIASVILAAYYKNIVPTAEMVYEEKAYRDSHRGTTFRYFKDRWSLTARYRRWNLTEIYEWLQQENPMVAIIKGWETRLYAIVIIGMDSEYVYYHDPLLGESKVLSHKDFQNLHIIGRNGIWLIKQ